MTLSNDELRQRVAEQFDQTVGVVESLVRIPSYNAPSAPKDALERSAQTVADLLRSVGAQDVRVVRAQTEDGTPGGPGVIGHIPGPQGAPTVLLYAHHDVQPVAKDWDTDPFEPVLKGTRLYGRGAADDAAGVAVHVGALRALGEDLGVGIAFFIEGEEESGSPTFATLLEQNKESLRADVIVIADSDNWSVDTPGLTASLRGVTDVTITLRTSEHAVHSGQFGGPVLDAPLLLARLIATVHDAEGNVAVEGLVQTGSADVDYPEAELRAAAGLLPGMRLAGAGSIADRLWWKPAVTLIGFDATSVDESSNTLAPVARARLSLRVPPGMDAVAGQAALHRHLVENAPLGAEVTVEDGVSGDGFLADLTSPAAEAAKWALSEGFGREVKVLGQGGSIPLAGEITEAFPGIVVLLTGVEDPDSRAHSGNESLSVELLERAVLSEALLLARLAQSA